MIAQFPLSPEAPARKAITASRPLLQRSCACGTCASGASSACKDKEEEKGWLDRSAVDSGAVDEEAPPIVHEVLRSHGRPLDPATRGFMESRFDRDFSRVRVHTDSHASDSARAVSASAYTVGEHMVFRTGAYAPATTEGKRLLAHELTHVAQQDSASIPSRLAMGRPGDRHEQEADRAARDLTEIPRDGPLAPVGTRVESGGATREGRSRPLGRLSVPLIQCNRETPLGGSAEVASVDAKCDEYFAERRAQGLRIRILCASGPTSDWSSAYEHARLVQQAVLWVRRNLANDACDAAAKTDKDEAARAAKKQFRDAILAAAEAKLAKSMRRDAARDKAGSAVSALMSAAQNVAQILSKMVLNAGADPASDRGGDAGESSGAAAPGPPSAPDRHYFGGSPAGHPPGAEHSPYQ